MDKITAITTLMEMTGSLASLAASIIALVTVIKEKRKKK